MLGNTFETWGAKLELDENPLKTTKKSYIYFNYDFVLYSYSPWFEYKHFWGAFIESCNVIHSSFFFLTSLKSWLSMKQNWEYLLLGLLSLHGGFNQTMVHWYIYSFVTKNIIVATLKKKLWTWCLGATTIINIILTLFDLFVAK